MQLWIRHGAGQFCCPPGVLETVGQANIDEVVAAGGVGGIVHGDVVKERRLDVERQRIAETAVELGIEAA